MDLLEISLFFGVSFLAAAVNAVAGGGTFLTFPVFIMGGLTPIQANIMSTVALWPGTLASARGYRGVLKADRAFLKPMVVIGMAGGAIGALLLLSTPEQTFAALVPWLLLVATCIFTFGPYCRPREGGDLKIPASAGMTRKKKAMLLQSATAVYGGYFGAGIGILTLAMLQLMRFSNIHEMNALKTLLTAAINTITLLIFVFSGEVVWAPAPAMIAGAVLGGYWSARTALRVPPEKVRFLVSFIGFAMTAYFFSR